MSTPQHKLDQTIAELLAKADRLKAIREALDDDAVRAELQEIFGSNGSPAKSRRRNKARASTYDRMREFFVNRGNEWATLSDMEKVGIVKPTARQVLYKGHPHEFERESNPGGARETKFRLKRPGSRDQGKQVRRPTSGDGDFSDKTISECARIILLERGGQPVHFRELAAEALRRGYKSNRKDSSDTSITSSFLSQLSRRRDFFEGLGDGKYRLREPAH